MAEYSGTEPDPKLRDLDATKPDDADGDPLDKVLAACGALVDRLDRMDARLDAMETDRGAKKDGEDKPELVGFEEQIEARDEPEDDAGDGQEGDGGQELDKELRGLDLPARGEFADVQARADSVAQAFGERTRAPQPRQGETLLAYRARLAMGLRNHSPAWASIDLRSLPEGAFAVAESAIYADAERVAPRCGTLREVKTICPATGRFVTEFRGTDTFIKALAAPSPRVTDFKWKTPAKIGWSN